MPVYGYCRVSTDRQANEGESLGVQERQLQGYVTMQGMKVQRIAHGACPSCAHSYEFSGHGKTTRTVVPWLSLARSTWPPSCWAKPSTSRPPIPESAR